MELCTVLTEVEDVLNNRPLTYIGEDINSTLALTPNRLLLAYEKVNMHAITPSTDEDDKTENKIKRATKDKLCEMWKYEERLSKFWNLFKEEYLLSLRERYQTNLQQNRIANKEQPKIGTVVLIEENLPRALWRIGKIESLVRNQDGQFRSAKILLPSGTILERSVKHVYPLEIPKDDI